MSKLTLKPTTIPSPYGETKKLSFKEYANDWGFLSLSKTKQLLDPYFRFKLFSSAKFNPVKFEEDKEKILKYYKLSRVPRCTDRGRYYRIRYICQPH